MTGACTAEAASALALANVATCRSTRSKKCGSASSPFASLSSIFLTVVQIPFKFYVAVDMSVGPYRRFPARHPLPKQAHFRLPNRDSIIIVARPCRCSGVPSNQFCLRNSAGRTYGQNGVGKRLPIWEWARSTAAKEGGGFLRSVDCSFFLFIGLSLVTIGASTSGKIGKKCNEMADRGFQSTRQTVGNGEGDPGTLRVWISNSDSNFFGLKLRGDQANATPVSEKDVG